MDQPTSADLEYQGKKHKTRRELFLERIEGLIPWQLWRTATAYHQPQAHHGDAAGGGLRTMRRLPSFVSLATGAGGPHLNDSWVARR